MARIEVLFVCLGNICRSPMAQGSLQQQLLERGLENIVAVDSCGTAAFNVGKPPDPRAIAATNKTGFDISQQVARQIDDADYQRCQYIIAMDRNNLSNVVAWAPADYSGEMKLLLDYSDQLGGKVAQALADPYYAEAGAFDVTLRDISLGTAALLERICQTHDL